MNPIFEDFHSRAKNLFASANSKNGLHYDGQFVTGRLYVPDTLFVGINPGFAGGQQSVTTGAFVAHPCKYIGESYLMARRIKDVVMGGNEAALSLCAETSYRSFLATSNVAELSRILAAQDQDWRKKHHALMQDWQKAMIETIKPKRIICLGIGNQGPFHDMLRTFRIDRNNGVERQLSEASSTGKTEPVFYKRATISGIPIHGIIHLSGAQPSALMLERLSKELS
ncbi:MAG: hypothetical protein RLZZ157_762 [Pseudomonadota bacterium]|jgi:hypothetical protein